MDEKKENLEQDLVECRNCQKITAAEDFNCTVCGEMVCLYCGCTDTTPCAGSCKWTGSCFVVRPGVCSECD